MLTANPRKTKIMKLGCYLMPYTKVNSSSIVGLYIIENVKQENFNMTKESLFINLGYVKLLMETKYYRTGLEIGDKFDYVKIKNFHLTKFPLKEEKQIRGTEDNCSTFNR